MKSKVSLSKPAMKERINATVLRSSNPALTWEAWTEEDKGSPVYWQIKDTAVGEALIGATGKGVCFLGFTNADPAFALSDLQRRFPASTLHEEDTEHLDAAFGHLNHPEGNLPVHLHLKGTDFQLGVWKKLLQIPFGGVATYKELGYGSPYARATGAAVGANPVSYLVPCHRAVRSDGSFDRYYWGTEMKIRLLTYESAATAKEE